ncbi:hypothetical protein DQE82_25165 [Micromonospora sp. LHW51205]|uniref:hypothetical protein n=1 Tax=Micromonospora sp. LHW51205 TaxID=2248752 RepID=UPI000DE91DC4|nr:hypothetical protein [Micromonospora sp. LHW51205]RBQ05616.1 hypothetical protein DQE82_25165 [Micromonospora sp. LHW51205]
MRAVFVFPAMAQAAVVALLDRLSPDQRHPWLVDGCLYPDLTDEDEHLYADWEPAAVRALSRARGDRPRWAVQVDVSGRVDGTVEVRRLTLTLLGRGGVAMDDYSDHVWTAEQIAADATVDGLRFFDFRGHYERNRLAR